MDGQNSAQLIQALEKINETLDKGFALIEDNFKALERTLEVLFNEKFIKEN